MKIFISHYAIIDKEGFGRSFQLAKNYAALGHEVVFLTSQSGMRHQVFPYRKIQRKGVLILAFPDIVPDKLRKMGLGPLNIMLKMFYAATNRFDFAQSDAGHRPASGWPCMLNRFMFQSKYISEWWEDFGKDAQFKAKPLYYRLTLARWDLIVSLIDKRKADFVFALSQKLRRIGIDAGVDDKKILVLNGGADTENITFFEKTKPFRNKFGIPENAFVFCYVGMGQQELEGDMLHFAKAFNQLGQSREVFWINTGRKLSPALREKYDLGANFLEFGWMEYDELGEFLSCADLFLLYQKQMPLNEARWPNKFGDYFAAGRKILVNPVGDLAGYIDKYPEVLISSENESDAILQTVTSFMDENQTGVSPDMRKIAEDELSWYHRASEAIEFCNSVNA